METTLILNMLKISFVVFSSIVQKKSRGGANSLCVKLAPIIVPQLSKCLKFEAVWGVLTDQMILI